MSAKQILILIITSLLICVSVVGGVYVATSFSSSFNPAYTDDGSEVTTKPITNGRVNVLLLGVDGSTNLSDTMIIASLDTKTKTISMLSIPRDTRVKIDGYYAKINSAIGHKGREQTTIDTVIALTGIPINYYARVNFEGFRNIIDVLGGVDIDVPMNMYYNDPEQNLHINLKKGLQHLDGKQSEMFVRYRAGYAEGDIGRVHAQQDFLKALIQQKLTLGNITRAKDIYNEVKSNVTTNLTMNDILGYAHILKGIDTSTITQVQVPGEPQMIGGVSYWVADVEKMDALRTQYFITK
ncbi:MAG: LCP family protein [Clostridiales bacterium]|jgi:LCP family protein required for cell wall assembly|nr:LCP family protein [Clostridiales bacterium]